MKSNKVLLDGWKRLCEVWIQNKTSVHILKLSNNMQMLWRREFGIEEKMVWAWTKQPTFRDAPTGFPAKLLVRNERRNSILKKRHYPDLGCASDRSCRVGNFLQPIRSTTEIWVVTRNQYGIFACISQTSFRRETSDGIAKCCLFSQARNILTEW